MNKINIPPDIELSAKNVNGIFDTKKVLAGVEKLIKTIEENEKRQREKSGK